MSQQAVSSVTAISQGADVTDTELITLERPSGRQQLLFIIWFGVRVQWNVNTYKNRQRLCIARGAERNVLRLGFICCISLLLII